MRLHWYGFRYGDKFTSVEEARREYERRERHERELSAEIRERIRGMSKEEREHFLESMS